MSQSDNNNLKTIEYNPKRAIILNELSVREKEHYYQLLLSNNTKFHRDNDGRYLARIRLLAPNVKVPRDIGAKMAFEERSKRLQEQNFINVSNSDDSSISSSSSSYIINTIIIIIIIV